MIAKAEADALLPTADAATYVNQSPATMASHRSCGIGPVFVKLGNRVFYRRGDLDDWIASRRVRSTADARTLESHARVTRPRAGEGTA